MDSILKLEREPILASESEAHAIQKLEVALSQHAPNTATVRLIGPNGDSLDLPVSVYTLLRHLVHDLAQGHAVTIMPIETELTTQQAADLLNVSRPFIVKLLESGEMPFHTVGTHRRIYLHDLLEYRKRRSENRRQYFARAAQEAQNMGLY